MPSKNKLTVEQREQRRAKDRERIKQEAEQLLSSEGWQQWVRTRASNGLAPRCTELMKALNTGAPGTCA